MIDSTNPRQLADNIRKLWDKFKSISGDLLPSRSTATTGQILKLTGENKTPSWADEYTPPAYSETETETGQKWTDGREIYKICISGTTPEITASGSFDLFDFSGKEIIELFGYLENAYGRCFMNSTVIGSVTIGLYQKTNGYVALYTNSTANSEKSYTCIVYYVKTPAPGRAPEDSDHEPEEVKEPEVKETKTPRKKTK